MKKRNAYIRCIMVSVLTLILLLPGCKNKPASENAVGKARYTDASLPVEERVEDLLAHMTLEEKVGQMAQAVISAAKPADVTRYSLGSILSGGGDHPAQGPETEYWLEHCNEYQKAALESRLGIPILYGIDSVHGSAKMVGATVFPHNIGLGATRDADLVEQIGRVTAIETAAGGVHWNFSPCVAVARDERWGRTYESFSESPDVVAELGAAYVRGHQAGDLADRDVTASCPKHYFADGGAEWGTSSHGIDRGNSTLSEEELRRIHLAPYKAVVKEDPATIMVSFSSVQDVKMHENERWIDVLRDELGFDGLLVSDWAAHTELTGKNKYARVINAGIDMIMIPDTYTAFISEVTSNVDEGIIPRERIDEAVRRILRLKFALGLFETPLADDSLLADVGSADHMAVARDAVRKSAVLLQHRTSVLPLSEEDAVAVVGTKAKDLGALSGGWTVYWGGYSKYETLPPMLEANSQRARRTRSYIKGTHILESIQERAGASRVLYSDDGTDIGDAQCALVVIGESPYVEFTGDTNDLSLSDKDILKVKNAKKQGIPVVAVLISGRPVLVNEIEPYCDAIIAAWLPGSMAGPGLTDLLYGDYEFTGKLPCSWPARMEQVPVNAGDGKEPRYPLGHGLTLK